MQKIKLKLSPKQTQVIKDLQTGGVLVTDSSTRGAWIGFLRGDNRQEYYIGNRVFWNLVDKGLIMQELGGQFNFELTDAGRTLPLKQG